MRRAMPTLNSPCAQSTSCSSCASLRPLRRNLTGPRRRRSSSIPSQHLAHPRDPSKEALQPQKGLSAATPPCWSLSSSSSAARSWRASSLARSRRTSSPFATLSTHNPGTTHGASSVHTLIGPSKSSRANTQPACTRLRRSPSWTRPRLENCHLQSSSRRVPWVSRPPRSLYLEPPPPRVLRLDRAAGLRPRTAQTLWPRARLAEGIHRS
mmetsp:Transcript_8591/g.25041  ORF Transcript_8591/g.25041 Transcript_8591/m.25041 type:complete len:210 (-) Transcript_8591:134-763(-)